jgi:hypothetical protein
MALLGLQLSDVEGMKLATPTLASTNPELGTRVEVMREELVNEYILSAPFFNGMGNEKLAEVTDRNEKWSRGR